MKIVKNLTFPFERALYNSSDLIVENCRFEGEEDGESCLKESTNVIVNNSYMDLRYPLWHVNHFEINDSCMTINCRAPLWYSCFGKINNLELDGVKAIRECHDITINNSRLNSPEFSWRTTNITINDSTVSGEYAFFLSRNVKLSNCSFSGKYSFQYVDGLIIENSTLDTKDAFWHTNNATIKNSIINGEYLGWYSTNLTLINCKIKGTQPLCYCKGLKVIDCEMIDADLSFEYSDCDAHIISDMVSIKNPTSGSIVVDGDCELILKDSKYPLNAKIQINKKVS